MAASPKYKVYNKADEYLAAFKYVSDALLFVDVMDDPGYTIRLGHAKALTLWTKGAESFDATTSHAKAVELVLQREDAANTSVKTTRWEDLR
jgi:hypothetical protein